MPSGVPQELRDEKRLQALMQEIDFEQGIKNTVLRLAQSAPCREAANCTPQCGRTEKRNP